MKYKVLEKINEEESYYDFENEKDAWELFDKLDNYYSIQKMWEELEDEVILILFEYEPGKQEMVAIEGNKFF